MINLIALLILIGILCAAILYIRKEKKRGVRCIGCPSAGSCSRSCCCNSSPNNSQKP